MALVFDDGSDWILFSDVPNQLPRGSGDRKIHISSVYRWALKGLRGVRLETVRIGGRKATSRRALAKFFKTLCDLADTSERSCATTSATEVSRVLDEEGIVDRPTRRSVDPHFVPATPPRGVDNRHGAADRTTGSPTPAEVR